MTEPPDGPLVSVVVPVHDEEDTLARLHDELVRCFDSLPYGLEIVFVDDGSRDGSAAVLDRLGAEDPRVVGVTFTRNFGKEAALTAGLHTCRGEACVMIDADLQHPVSLVPEFLARWEAGADVVVGVRETPTPGGPLRRLGARFFDAVMSRVATPPVARNATDFRLVDRAVVDDFNRLGERTRMTRTLIDWLGYDEAVVPFRTAERASGRPAYSTGKLVRLALDGIVSVSLFPLRLAGYVGIVMTPLAGLACVGVAVYRYVLHDPWGLDVTGSAVLALLLVFLTGIVLVCLGLIALYIGQIRAEVLGRPLYVVRRPRGTARGHGDRTREPAC